MIRVISGSSPPRSAKVEVMLGTTLIMSTMTTTTATQSTNIG